MMTVKHIERSGHESVVSAMSVSFDPAIGQNNEYPSGQVVAFGVPDATSDGCNRYSDGRVYVMNQNGRTIADYNLDRNV